MIFLYKAIVIFQYILSYIIFPSGEFHNITGTEQRT